MHFLRNEKKRGADVTTSADTRWFSRIGRDLGLTARNLILAPVLRAPIVYALNC
jgi:hypothetical protein